MSSFFSQSSCFYNSPLALPQCLVLGSGPCGLRTAIELALLGAQVVVLEKRESFTRNNVLHLWPFTIYDLRELGAKKFYGKFCSGSLDHISEWQLLCKGLVWKSVLMFHFYLHFHSIREEVLFFSKLLILQSCGLTNVFPWSPLGHDLPVEKHCNLQLIRLLHQHDNMINWENNGTQKYLEYQWPAIYRKCFLTIFRKVVSWVFFCFYDD